MPPKPWETRKKPTVQNISQIIQSNPTAKEEVPKLPSQQSSPIRPTTESAENMRTTNSYGGMSSGYGNSYGSSYGSSYGGYGGYGSMGSYGGYGGYGSYGMGYGRMGMMGGPEDQKGFLFNTMVTLQSFGFLIQTLCQIGRSIDQNCEGLNMFYTSFKNLLKKCENGAKGSARWVVRKIVSFFSTIYNFIIGNLFLMKKKDLKTKYKIIRLILALSVVLVSISFYPIVKNSLK